MKFSIITPTFKRSSQLKRAVDSVINQTYQDWEIIIINDSPSDESYYSFASTINDQRIRYYMNERNRGVNFSRNFGLDHLSADSRWVIFLDDDDYLAPDTLNNFSNLILAQGEQKWFMTNRALKNGQPLTTGAKDDTTYSYAWEYLIRKKIKGDATHCIETKLITEKATRFLKHVKQGEEWFFFYQVGLHTKLYYSDHNSTISDGYDSQTGLNFRKRTLEERLTTLVTIGYEAQRLHIFFSASLLTYLTARLLLAFIKRN